ncbi:hypothetical protein SDC9_193285 [bioreactor metagenome]|uniref:Uncharacterized protein n=1 Tax=bioreactor metagenome TaxID=1076179 RepID=A0A645I351_9ZZZZ
MLNCIFLMSVIIECKILITLNSFSVFINRHPIDTDYFITNMHFRILAHSYIITTINIHCIYIANIFKGIR